MVRLREQAARLSHTNKGHSRSRNADGGHLLACKFGGGWFLAHDTVAAVYLSLAAKVEGLPDARRNWKPRVDAWPRQTRRAEADFGQASLPGPGLSDICFDVVISLANPDAYPAAADRISHVAEMKAGKPEPQKSHGWWQRGGKLSATLCCNPSCQRLVCEAPPLLRVLVSSKSGGVLVLLCNLKHCSAHKEKSNKS